MSTKHLKWIPWIEFLWGFEDRIHSLRDNLRIYYYGLGLGDYFIGLVSIKRGRNGKSC